MGRKQALPTLTALAGTLTVFVVVEPKQGEAVIEKPRPSTIATLGSLQVRGHTVRIEAFEGEPVYTVLDANGQVLAEHLDLVQLAEQYPELAPGAFYADDTGKPLGPLMIVPDHDPF